jgi:hypothetical protein
MVVDCNGSSFVCVALLMVNSTYAAEVTRGWQQSFSCGTSMWSANATWARSRVIGYSARKGIVNGRISVIFHRIHSVKLSIQMLSMTDHVITARVLIRFAEISLS